MTASVVFERVRSFWFGSVSVLPLCLARLILGFVMLSAYLSLAPSYATVLGADGLLGSSFLADVPGPTIGRATTENVRWLQHASGPVQLGLHSLLLVSAAAFMVGFRTRLAGVVALALHIAFHGRNEFVFWGWADMVTPFTFYVVMAPSGRRLSVDALLGRTGRVETGQAETGSDDRQMEAWPLRLMQIHVCLVYVVAAWSRLDNPHWIDGSMLSRILADGTFTRAPVLGDAPPPLLTLVTYAAWAVELAAPFSLWQAATRRWMVAALVVMHTGLELTTRVGWWNVVMLAGLLTFMPDTWLERIAAAITTWCRRVLRLMSRPPAAVTGG